MRHRWLKMLDTYANATYGRDISSAISTSTCVRCDEPVHPFTSFQAADRYPKVGLCERCQQSEQQPKDTVVPFKPRFRKSNQSR